MLVGKRINIRRTCKDDLKYFLDWFNNEEIYYLTSTPFYLQNKDTIERSFCIENPNTMSFIVELKDSTVIGYVALHGINWINKTGEFEIVIANKEFRNKNYWLEIYAVFFYYIFNTLNLRKISGFITEYNRNSYRLMEYFGIEREALIKKHFYYNDCYYDRYIYSVFRDDYKKRLEKISMKYIILYPEIDEH